MFHERLHSALDLMIDFFHAEGQALAMEILHSASYYQVEQRLQYHRTDTETLTEMFYMQRLQEQTTITISPYGNLAVRAYFNHDSLCVEVSLQMSSIHNSNDKIQLSFNSIKSVLSYGKLIYQTRSDQFESSI